MNSELLGSLFSVQVSDYAKFRSDLFIVNVLQPMGILLRIAYLWCYLISYVYISGFIIVTVLHGKSTISVKQAGLPTLLIKPKTKLVINHPTLGYRYFFWRGYINSNTVNEKNDSSEVNIKVHTLLDVTDH